MRAAARRVNPADSDAIAFLELRHATAQLSHAPNNFMPEDDDVARVSLHDRMAGERAVGAP